MGITSLGTREVPLAGHRTGAHKRRETTPERLPPRLGRDRALGQETRRVYEENFRVHGAGKVWRQVGREGPVVARCTIERLTGAHGCRNGDRRLNA
jgi:hypothetical protein